MPINGGTIKDGMTGLTPVGGTDMPLTLDGQVVAGGVHTADASEADFRIRSNATWKSKMPTLNAATGTYSKSKFSCTFVEPKILSTGGTVFNLARVELETHPECTIDEVNNLRYAIAQLISDAQYDNFWTAGSLA